MDIQNNASLDLSSFMPTGKVSKSGDALKFGNSGTSQTGDLLGSFQNTLQQEMNKVNQLQVASEQTTSAYASGADIPIHQVIAAATKAELSMDLTVAIRNKMIAAYQEISHMQI